MTAGLTRRGGMQLGLVVAAFVAVGALAGLLWERVWSPPIGVVVDHRWAPENAVALQDQFSGTGWYVLIATGAGLLVGVVASILVDRVPLLTLAAVVVGSALAAWLMLVVGTALGPPDPQSIAKTADDGTRLPAELEVSGYSPFFALPVGALAGLLIVFLGLPSRSRRVEREEDDQQAVAD